MIERPERAPIAYVRGASIVLAAVCVAAMTGVLAVPACLPDGWRAIGFTLAGMVVGILALPLEYFLRAPSYEARARRAEDMSCDWLEQLAAFQVGRPDTTDDVRDMPRHARCVTPEHATGVLEALDRMRGEHYMDVYDAFVKQLNRHPENADLLDKAYRQVQGEQFEGRPISGLIVCIDKRTREVTLSDVAKTPGR